MNELKGLSICSGVGLGLGGGLGFFVCLIGFLFCFFTLSQYVFK